VLNVVAACHSFSCDMYTTSAAVGRCNVSHRPVSSCVTVYVCVVYSYWTPWTRRFSPCRPTCHSAWYHLWLHAR
jgi:hypothetical protein